MSLRPPSPLRGSDPLTKWLNDLLEYVKSLEVKSVKGGRVSRGAQGTHLVINGRTFPLKELKVCEDDGSTPAYMFFAYKKPPNYSVTADSSKVTADSVNITADQ